MLRSAASSIASERRRADADEDRGAGDRRLLDELERQPPADAEDALAQREQPVEQRAADDLVHRVVAADVLARDEQRRRRRRTGRSRAGRRCARSRAGAARVGQRGEQRPRDDRSGRSRAAGVHRDLLERALAADPARGRRVEAPRAGVAQQRARDLDDVCREVGGQARPRARRRSAPRRCRNPSASSSSWPGVRIVTASGSPSTRISSGSSTATSSRARRRGRRVAIMRAARRRPSAGTSGRPGAARAPACATAASATGRRRPRRPCTPGSDVLTSADAPIEQVRAHLGEVERGEDVARLDALGHARLDLDPRRRGCAPRRGRRRRSTGAPASSGWISSQSRSSSSRLAVRRVIVPAL